MSGSVTTGQRVRDGGGVGILAHPRLQHRRICGCERRALEGRQKHRNRCLLRSPHRGLERSKREAATVPWLTGISKETRMQRTTRMGVASCVGASLILLGAVSSTRAADE
jgi:hypothetical protein